MSRVLVTGATGFVGSHLVAALVEAGHDVLAMTRHPEDYRGPGEAVGGDVFDPETLREPMAASDRAYYLVHSLDDDDFVRKDAEAARGFAAMAAETGLKQIIYLGGLGRDDDDLSDHLRSRREVESILAEGSVPVTVLRAAIVIGAGGISWEITRQLVGKLPLMVGPKWVSTRTQPIALPDAVRYLIGVLDNEQALGRTFEIGGSEVLTYAQMMQRVAQLQFHRPLPILMVPLLTPRLSSHWLSLVTDVNTTTGRNLVDSMTHEVVVTENSVRDVVPFEPMGYDDAVRAALTQDRS